MYLSILNSVVLYFLAVKGVVPNFPLQQFPHCTKQTANCSIDSFTANKTTSYFFKVRWFYLPVILV